MKNKLINAIYSSIDEINRGLSDENKIKKNESTVIFGDGKIDSLAFINFISSIEENIFNEFSISIDLTNEDVLMEEVSPFRTVSTLAEYIEILINKDKDSDDDK